MTLRERLIELLEEEYRSNIRHGQDDEDARGNACHDVEAEVSVILDDWQEGRI